MKHWTRRTVPQSHQPCDPTKRKTLRKLWRGMSFSRHWKRVLCPSLSFGFLYGNSLLLEKEKEKIIYFNLHLKLNPSRVELCRHQESKNTTAVTKNQKVSLCKTVLANWSVTERLFLVAWHEISLYKEHRCNSVDPSQDFQAVCYCQNWENYSLRVLKRKWGVLLHCC